MRSAWIAAATAVSLGATAALAAPMPPPSILPYGNPAGAEIRKGVFIDITAAGFNQFTQIAKVFVPETVPIDASGFNQYGDVGSALAGLEYVVEISNVYVNPELKQLIVTPKEGDLAREGGELFKNGQIEASAILTADVSDPNDPALVDIEVTANLLFFDITLLDDTCKLWIEKEVLGDIEAKVGLALGPKKNINGFTARACNPGEVCADQAAGVECLTACADDNESPACQYENPGDDPRFLLGGPICIDDPNNPPFPPLCWEAEKPYWAASQPPRDCDGYIEPYIDTSGVELNLDQLNLELFKLVGIDCGGFLDFMLAIAEALPGVIDDNIGGVVADTVEPAIVDAVNDVLPDIQESIDRELWIGESLDLLGTPLELNVGPGDFFVDDRGLRMELWTQIGGTRTTPAPCVSPYIGLGEDGSRRTIPTGMFVDPFPELGDAFSGTLSTPAQITALIDDDVVNQALFGVWRDGLLCQTIDSANLPFELPAGLDLDTSLIKAFAQGELDDLFPEPGPLILATRPQEAPIMEVIDGADGAGLDIGLDGFGVDIYAELDGRFMRVVGVELGGDLKANVTPTFTPKTGSAPASLAVSVGVNLDGLQPTPTFGDLAPSATTPIADGLGTVLRTVAGSLLDDLLGELVSFDLPEIFGIGVEEVEFGATGSEPTQIKDFFGLYGTIGTDAQEGDLVGCDLLGGSGGGCGGSGGSSGGGLGCQTVPTRMITLFVLPLAVAGLRRQRRRSDRPA